MAALDDLVAQFNAAMTALATRITGQMQQITELQNQIAAWQAHVESGESAALAALQPVADQLTALGTQNPTETPVDPAPGVE
jgi:uncharacterized coiled-coil protein SlyX